PDGLAPAADELVREPVGASLTVGPWTVPTRVLAGGVLVGAAVDTARADAETVLAPAASRPPSWPPPHAAVARRRVSAVAPRTRRPASERIRRSESELTAPRTPGSAGAAARRRPGATRATGCPCRTRARSGSGRRRRTR